MIAVALAAGVAMPTGLRAQIAFPDVVDRTVGVRMTLGPGAALDRDDRARWRFEVGDAELFGIAGLRVVGVRSTAAVGAAVLTGEFSEIASPVGNHARAIVEAGYARPGAWQGALRAGVERVSLRGAEPERSLVGGAFSRADVGPVSIVADLEVVSGFYAQSTSVSIAAIGHAGPFATVVGSARFDGSRVVAVGVAVIASVHPRLGLIAGYDDGTETSRLAARIVVGDMDVSTGVAHHPVLGLSHVVSVAWMR